MSCFPTSRAASALINYRLLAHSRPTNFPFYNSAHQSLKASYPSSNLYSRFIQPSKQYSTETRSTQTESDTSTVQKNTDSKAAANTNSSNPLQPNLTLNASKKPIRFSKSTSFLQKIFSPFVPQYQSIQIGQNIYSTCSFTEEQYDQFWLKQANMNPSFQSWFSITLLYVWLNLTRLRSVEHSKFYKQQLIDSFFAEAEERIKKTGINSGKIVNDSLKDLTANYFGCIMSFDEGLITNDAVLAGSVWRNILSNCENAEVLYLVVLYIRRQLKMLDQLDNSAFILGKYKFEDINDFYNSHHNL
ncbi:Protein CBP3, mitochondrial [Smittium culicis]|uniref:Protein CBP3, mitochondrial n=1 Tax=Smittium culicis TaxID=133412 RepID=A0A1R1XXQ6_9FUNG|nr:Protein CBP3, mitochondrial [Smittium culicis]OMJ19463.1 Protein CBP3, mitochondrial [Smittium culicis]